MISETGHNLSVLIITETGQDWETFSTWYSFYKNLPHAKVSIACARNSETPFQYYQWTKKINLPVTRHQLYDPENEISSRLDSIGKSKLTTNILAIKPLIMAIDVLDKKLLDQFNSENEIFDKDIWFLKDPNIPDILNSYVLGEKEIQIQEKSLYSEVKETEDIRPLMSYKKGCGKWIDTLKGCPFSNAQGLITAEMTASENRIVELWKKMCALYSVVV